GAQFGMHFPDGVNRRGAHSVCPSRCPPGLAQVGRCFHPDHRTGFDRPQSAQITSISTSAPRTSSAVSHVHETLRIRSSLPPESIVRSTTPAQLSCVMAIPYYSWNARLAVRGMNTLFGGHPAIRQRPRTKKKG